MPSVERSAGAVVFRRGKGNIEYLLLHYMEGHWDFPKGHIEKGEETEQTVRREIKEETGIKRVRFLPDFREMIRYLFSYRQKRILKYVVYLLAQTPQKKVAVSHEHRGYVWLGYSEAFSRITFDNSRVVLKKADRFLNP